MTESVKQPLIPKRVGSISSASQLWCCSLCSVITRSSSVGLTNNLLRGTFRGKERPYLFIQVVHLRRLNSFRVYNQPCLAGPGTAASTRGAHGAVQSKHKLIGESLHREDVSTCDKKTGRQTGRVNKLSLQKNSNTTLSHL